MLNRYIVYKLKIKRIRLNDWLMFLLLHRRLHWWPTWDMTSTIHLPRRLERSQRRDKPRRGTTTTTTLSQLAQWVQSPCGVAGVNCKFEIWLNAIYSPSYLRTPLYSDTIGLHFTFVINPELVRLCYRKPAYHANHQKSSYLKNWVFPKLKNSFRLM